MSEKKKNNIGTYAVVLFLSAIFIIIIAAMADSREDHFENQISTQTKLTQGAQDTIVNLENENYNLKKEVEELKGKAADEEKALTFYKTMNSVSALALEGNSEEAKTMLQEIDPTSLTEEQKTAYDTLLSQLDPSVEKSQK